MSFRKRALALLALSLLFVACREGENGGPALSESCSSEILDLERHLGDHGAGSRLFLVDSACGERVALIRAMVGSDTLSRVFVLRDSAASMADKQIPGGLSKATVLHTPLRRVVPLSSAQIGYMLRLGIEDRIVAVGEGKYIADSALYARVDGDGLAVGNGNTLNFERLIALSPDLVMTFATGGTEDDYGRMERLGIPVMLTSEWQEDSPMAKAEWLRLYGALFGKETLADSILREESLQVQSLLGKRGDGEPCDGPRVLAGMSYGGVWYAPGGRSYTASLIKAAGGCYLWAHDSSRDLRLTVEEVIARADSFDVWVNPGMFSTSEEVLTAEPRVGIIKAFREKRVYQNDGRRGPGGGNDFFERGVAMPAEMILNLKSLILSESLPSLTPAVPVQPGVSGKTAVSADMSPSWYHNIF